MAYRNIIRYSETRRTRAGGSRTLEASLAADITEHPEQVWDRLVHAVTTKLDELSELDALEDRRPPLVPPPIGGRPPDEQPARNPFE